MADVVNKSLVQVAGGILLTALSLGDLDASDRRHDHALQTLDRVTQTWPCWMRRDPVRALSRSPSTCARSILTCRSY